MISKGMCSQLVNYLELLKDGEVLVSCENGFDCMIRMVNFEFIEYFKQGYDALALFDKSKDEYELDVRISEDEIKDVKVININDIDEYDEFNLDLLIEKTNGIRLRVMTCL